MALNHLHGYYPSLRNVTQQRTNRAVKHNTMPFYTKFLIVICVSCVVAWFTIKALVSSTDHLPERFSASTVKPGELAESTNRASSATADQDKIDSESFDEIIREKTELEKEKRANAQRVLDNPELTDLEKAEQVLKINNTSVTKENAANSQSLTRDDNEKKVADSNSRSVRSDSDADMQATGTSQASKTKPDTQLAGSTRKKASAKTSEIIKPAKTVQALDVAYAPPDDSNCSFPSEIVKVGVDYRNTSYAIKGHSLTNIDQLIDMYKKCGGKLLILQNAQGLENTEERLIQLRKDEVKYYLLQRRVPKDDMIFPDNL